MLLTILVVILVIYLLGGGIGYRNNPGFIGTPYGAGYGGIGLLLIIVLLVLLFRGGTFF